jgi:hypothetical protein
LRNYRNGTLFAVVEAAKDSRKQGTPDPRDTKGYYKALNVERDADQKKIKSAYRKLALKYHVSTFFHFISFHHAFFTRLMFLIIINEYNQFFVAR